MKKILAIWLCITIMFVLAACGNSPSEITGAETSPGTENQMQIPESNTAADTTSSIEGREDNGESGQTGEENILIAYFSRAGENYNVGTIEKGNTEIIAEIVSEQTGGSLFHIETVTPYPESYMECTAVAQQEQRDNARPELSGSVENMDDYEVIFLGYPNWWGDMPMAVYTFLESYDFSGKTIVPFCTHEGSGLSGTEGSIKRSCPDADVLKGLAVQGKTAQTSYDKAESAVIEWLSENGFVE